MDRPIRVPVVHLDESSAAALGSLLCELDAQAATLLAATGSEVAVQPVQSADPGIRGTRGDRDATRGALPRRRGVLGGRLVPIVGLTAVAVVGIIGGITIAATQVSRVELPNRSIMSEPVPYTLHDSEPNGAAGGSAKTPRPRNAGSPGAARSETPVASQNLSDPASPAGPPSVPGPSAAPSGPIAVPRQGSNIPQPRAAGFPPRRTPRPDEDRLDDMVSDAGDQAAQLQEAQLRELAEQMENAMGLAIGLRTR